MSHSSRHDYIEASGYSRPGLVVCLNRICCHQPIAGASVELLLKVVRWELMLFLLGLAGIVVFYLMTGRINTHKLLSSKQGDAKGAVSPERVQLLLMTVGTAALTA